MNKLIKKKCVFLLFGDFSECRQLLCKRTKFFKLWGYYEMKGKHLLIDILVLYLIMRKWLISSENWFDFIKEEIVFVD